MSQKGGIPGVPGYLEHTQLLREARENPSNLAVLWLDLANAYGSIPHKVRLGLLFSTLDWKMEVDLGKQLQFPGNITHTTLRPDIVL